MNHKKIQDKINMGAKQKEKNMNWKTCKLYPMIL